MRTSDEWAEILSDSSIHFVTCFNGREEHPANCINDELNWVHKDDIDEYLDCFIGMSADQLIKLKTELYAKLKEI